MSIVILILMAVGFVLLAAYVIHLVRNDGYGYRPSSGLPQSHLPDIFNPTRHLV